MKEPCFVTGGSGFIGQHLLARLTADEHPTQLLMRRPEALPELQHQVDSLGGRGALLSVVGGDLNQPGLGLQGPVQPAAVVFHLGAQFAWGLSHAQARQVNVEGALQVAEMAARQGSRLLMVGGYMLENTAHLQRVGVDLQAPEHTDWPAVYRQVGGYEGSKLEAHFRVLQAVQASGAALTLVHPATVCGHSQSGHILAGQPLAQLVRNLLDGLLSAVPGSPAHWLPMVTVDFLVALMVAAAFDPQQSGRQVLALDEQTPNLQGLLATLAAPLGLSPPRRHLPIGLLRLLLRIPGLERLLRTSAESLDFIQTTRFDTAATRDLARRYGLAWPDIGQSLRATARYVAQTLPA
ncbi:MAG: SDR family oxidoreductase [Pseudomonas sp.]|uniref:SDR family oxidoreductase n=1 Tax=Pseudomonas sp. TaxID=306 RepID=UPI0033998258